MVSAREESGKIELPGFEFVEIGPEFEVSIHERAVMLARRDQELGLAPEAEIPRIFRVKGERIGGGARSRFNQHDSKNKRGGR